ncbi:TLDc domain containing protein 2 [Cordyceps fumosorosea ARSEF 2679]|uniref:Restriction of telomere capping protein 5 n=1 Tax=Cordyceps fumosorosea (strain ARSEF 2679) TaxID=1081104 RepID=A0A167V5H9_CORFA|nr:TLDc domain containing protein 2 [Cordyceps fumosorosea ARSEF 2679]OAA62247.1 TLDc domain containing protein 2 [Cordyceps fumosorosea ARSEF 2679]
MSDEQPPQRSKEELLQDLAVRFKEKCFSSLEFYSLKDVFKTLADHQGGVSYLKEDTVARYLEIPDILGASPVLFQMVSYIGAFPFLAEAPVILELPHLIMVVVIMTERYKRVLDRGPTDRTKLLFKSMAVYDRKASATGPASPTVKSDEPDRPGNNSLGFTIDQPGQDEDDEYADDDLVLTAFELLDIGDAVKQGSVLEVHGAIIPTDNFRKLVMLLLLVAPLGEQDSLSRYSNRVTGIELEHLRASAESIISSFVDVETSPGIRYHDFKRLIPIIAPNLFAGFNNLFGHFLFSKNLDFTKHKGDEAKLEDKPAKLAQPLVLNNGEILNGHLLAQIATFLPASDLFHRVRLLYSGNDSGFSIGSFESKVFNWAAPTILLVSGSRIADKPGGGPETKFAESLPLKRYPNGSKGERVTFGVYVREPWKHTHRGCFGDSETVLFQLEPVHDIFRASTINTDYVTFTKAPANPPCMAFGCPHPKPTKSGRSSHGTFSLGAVSLLLDDSFEFGVFHHDFSSRGGAFRTSSVRQANFEDRFQVEKLEVWGCGGDKEAAAQAERWAWEEREAEARRKINLGSGSQEQDRALLEMAGLIGSNRSGGSMG